MTTKKLAKKKTNKVKSSSNYSMIEIVKSDNKGRTEHMEFMNTNGFYYVVISHIQKLKLGETLTINPLK